MKKIFSDIDIELLKHKGIDLKTVETQITCFEKGFPFLNIIKAATIGDGIIKIEKENEDKYILEYDNSLINNKVLKFVPASGAASRMFKNLYNFLETYDESDESYNKFIADSSFNSTSNFFNSLLSFAFYNDLMNIILVSDGEDLEELLLAKDYIYILSALLTNEGLNYGSLPKALLKFHRYDNQYSRTPIEEHLVEGAYYACNTNKQVPIHFTVSPEHKELFKEHVAKVKENYERRFGVEFEISYSEQKQSTDTVAVDLENKPFRNSDGSLLFRPGGHGALIENLNEMDADIVFIKNIDNIVPDKLKESTIRYKKLLAGCLIHFQKKITNYLNQLDKIQDIDENKISEIIAFIQKNLSISLNNIQFENKTQKIAFLHSKLNRPIRVCGMVKNEGEPGGGPFWAVNTDQTISLQIVESSQVDINNTKQKEILQNATHFNPVDLVCGLKDYKGNKFNLLQYIDPQTGFISQKSKDGKELKALELPGLWNGAMSNWNTIFVEVPIITFNPVKTVNDLLRDEHQA